MRSWSADSRPAGRGVKLCTYVKLLTSVGWHIVLWTLQIRPGAASGGFSPWRPHPGDFFWSRKTVGPFSSRGPLKDGGERRGIQAK